MENIREYLKNPLYTAIAGVILGAIFGLVILGWLVWPVEWINATPAHLSREWKSEFLRTSIAAFGQNGDVARAQDRYAAIGSEADSLLSEIAMDPQGLSDVLIGEFKSITGSSAPMKGAPPKVTEPVLGMATQPALESVVEKPEKETKSSLPILLAALCVMLLAVGGFLGYMLNFRKRALTSDQLEPMIEAVETKKKVGYTDYAAENTDAPIAQFMASYKIGDDLFDDSFSIDSASGEFLGECGVGISETIGIGEQKKVTAFEVWLFDKNDIQTITKVLMSEHAFNDPTVRQRLEAKGEPVLIEPGIEIVLETLTLQLVARVVDMSYGNGALPEESYFDHMLVEMAVWSKL